MTGETDTINNCSVAVAVNVGAAPAPDLVVDAPTVSESAPASGDRFTLNATVRNQGSASSVFTRLHFYQSADSAIAPGDRLLGSNGVPSLDPSESENESFNVTAPSTPGTYYYGACVDSVTSEIDTNNNCSLAVTVTVGAAPAPDLVVDAPTVSESAPAAEGRFTLNATVRNQGNGRSDSTTLRYYQSADATISTADTEVGTDSVFRLNAADSGAESLSLTAPSTPGTYYYGACVDSVTGETDTSNNCSVAVTVTVGAAPTPDLVVDAPTVSESAPAAGDRFTLNAAVRNQGNGRSDSTTLRYYQSADATISAADTEVGTDSVFRLNASGRENESLNVTAPSTPGTYYYGACVDSVTDETDTNNNCSVAVAVNVGGDSSTTPDLVVDMGGGTGTSVAGTSFDIQLAVRNQGAGATSASTTLRFYRSADATITDADTEVGTDTVGPLGGSNGISRHSIDLTAPSSKGTYYYGACVDAVAGETNTDNNCSSARTITITALGPDLVVTQVNVPEDDPIEDEDFSVSIHVKNQGDSRALSPTARFYRSTDATISSRDTEIGTLRLRHMEASDHFDRGSIKVSTTAPSTAGTYYYGACIDAAEGESDTTNNCSSGEAVTVVEASGSDLVIESFRIPAIDANFPTLPMYATVRNQGSGWSASTPVSFYLSTDATITTSDTRIDGQYVKRLAPSETSGYGDVQVTTTAESTPGTYYYGACVQAVSGETDTTNNCSDAVAVTVSDDDDAPSAPGKPTSLTATAEGQTEIDLSWTAPSDDGGAAITGYRIEVSTNGSSWSDLAADTGSTSASYSHTGLTAGSTRHYRVSAINSAGTGPASDSDSATTEQVVPGSPDLVVVNTLAAANVSPGHSLSLNATVRNQGDGASTSTTLRYYFSSDPTITTSDTEAGTNEIDSIVPSGNERNAIAVTVPSTPGKYYYGACVDAVTGESDATNNCSTATEVTVRVVNQPPQVVGDVDDKVVKEGESFTVDLSSLFSDPDGDDITSYGFTFRTSGILTGIANSKSGILSLSAVNIGETIVAVDARDSNGTWSSLEDLFKVTVTAAQSATAPGSPTGLTATADGQTEIDLSWTVPSDDGGAAITGYKIEVSTNGSSWSDLAADTKSTSASYSHTGLTAGSTRHYRVSAINSAGTGPASDSDSATTDAASAPGAPTGLTATADGQTEIDLSWNAPADDGGAAITGYKIEVSTNGSSWSDLAADTGSTSASYSHTGLTAGTTRHYRVSAINSAGTGPVSNTDSATTDAASAPDLTVDAPTVNDSTVDVDDSFTLSVRVRNRGNASSDSAKLSYQRSLGDSTFARGHRIVAVTSMAGLAVSESILESTDLTAPSSAGTYYYRVCVFEVSGESDTDNNCSTAVAVTVSASVSAPGAPTGLRATADSETEIDLSWTAPSDDGGAAITGYKIEVSTDGSSWSDLVADTNSTSTSYSHTGLTADSTRHYRVSAINSAGTGQVSNTDSATTDSPPAQETTCSVNLVVRAGESCTYPGRSDKFSVDSSGTASFLSFSAGKKIAVRNTNINGVVYTLVAGKQSDGTWKIEEVG